MKTPWCKHLNLRCVHGDEIIYRGYKRVVCVDCGKALELALPEKCWYTGENHGAYKEMKNEV